MIELMLECWSRRDGGADNLWSLWVAGKRVEMGGPFDDADRAEAAGRTVCRERLGREPDRVTRL